MMNSIGAEAHLLMLWFLRSLWASSLVICLKLVPLTAGKTKAWA